MNIHHEMETASVSHHQARPSQTPADSQSELRLNLREVRMTNHNQQNSPKSSLQPVSAALISQQPTYGERFAVDTSFMKDQE